MTPPAAELGGRVTLDQLHVAVRRAPEDAATHARLARAHEARREDDAAIVSSRRATGLEPGRARYWFDLARLLARNGHWSGAIDADRAGLAIAPDAGAAARLGACLGKMGDREAALRACATAMALAPGERAGYDGLCALLLAEHPPEEIESMSRAWVPAGADPMALRVGIATALARRGRHPEALTRWMGILHEVPDHPRALVDAAAGLTFVGEASAAERLALRALERYPTSVEIVLLHIDLLYRTGRLDAIRDRLRASEVRAVLAGALDARPDGATLWDGVQSLAGKTILVETRGGYGDGLQYGRLLPLLKALGARVIVQGFPGITSLLRTLPGADEVVAPFEACAPYDYHCRAKYAVFLLDWTWAWSAGVVPYLSVEAEQLRVWRARFDPRHLNVGIIWHSRDSGQHDAYTYRSAPLAAFQALARVPGVALYGLQVGPGAADVTPETSTWLVRNFDRECRDDIRQAAAAVQALDAIVSVDTGTAHLIGALGRPSFVLLPYSASARWMTDAPDVAPGTCPWYPTARVHRQARPGDWASALTPVAAELARLVARQPPA